MKTPFILIASYPKSGNTWTRIIFDKLRRGVNLSINDLDSALHGHSRRVFDNISPADASDLLNDEICTFLPDVYRRLANGIDQMAFIKVHECACRFDNEWLYPPECVNCVVYLVRHPFDVAVSMADFFGQSVEIVVRAMGGETAIQFAPSWLPGVLSMRYGSWSENVLSWLDAKPYRLVWARYEDLYTAPVKEFQRLAAAVGLDAEESRVARVVEASRFDSLRQEEAMNGFREKPETSAMFFRAGRPRSWEGALSGELRERILRDHGPVMERLGYTEDGGVVPLSVSA